MHYTPWLTSEHVPDFSTLDNLLQHPRFAGKQGEALAVALWDLMVDRDLGIFHYCPPFEPFWERDSNDPLLIWNVFGFTICHVHANVLAMMMKAAGFQARIANVTGHEGTEVFYDGRWHYFDGDIQMFHRLRPPQANIIASRQDLHDDPTLATDQPNPSNPYIFPDRDPQAVATMYASECEYLAVLEDRIHAMDYRLRPGEEILRHFYHRGRWHVFDNYLRMFRQYRQETGAEGPTERYWPRRQWGNGFFSYAPDLTAASRDAELGADLLTGLRATDRGLTVVGDQEPAVAQFAFESPYLYCGVPDPLKRLPAEDGAILDAQFDLPPNTRARIDCRPGNTGDSAAAPDWQPVWQSLGNTGPQSAHLDFTVLTEGRFRFDLRFVLEGPGATLRNFQTCLWFMCSPSSLPALKTAGANRMTLRHGDRYALPTRSFLTQRSLKRPESIAAAAQTENLRHDPNSYPLLLPVDPAQPWKLTYELKAPAGGTLQWADVYALFEGRKPDEKPDGCPATIEAADTLDGPWTTVGQMEIAEHKLGWHFGLHGHARFGGQAAGGYIRFSAKKGLKGFRVNSHYTPAHHALGAEPTTPLAIEHVWFEDDPQTGRRQKRHVETVPAQTADHTYTVRCTHPPHDAWVSLRAGHAQP